MTPQELKNSILQLAIQGKLVEQRAEEGTAAELMEKILAAKNAKGAKKNLTQSRGARGENKTSAPSAFPRDKIPDDEKPFDIPESWEWVRLGEVCEILDSKRRPITKSERTSGPYPYYGASCVQDYVADYIFDEPLVLLGEDGAKWGRGDNSAFRISGKAWVNNHAHVLRPLPEIDHAYLVHTLCILDLRIFVTGTTVPKLNQARMCQILFPLPPLAEQKRIVAKIEELLPLIDRYEKAWSRLEDFNKRFPVDMQKSLLQMAIQGKLVEQRAEEGTGEELLEKILAAKNAKGAKGNLTRSRGARGENKTSAPSASPREKIPDDEKPFDIPKSWEWVRLKEITTKITDGTHHSPPNQETGDFMYVTAKNIKDEGVIVSNITYVSADVHAEIFARCNPELGDILLIKDGATTGVVTVNNIDRPFSLLSSVALLKLPENICAWYLVYALRSDLFYKLLRKQMKGTGITRITLKQIEPLHIPLPPLAEQKRIVAKLEELLPLCERLR